MTKVQGLPKAVETGRKAGSPLFTLRQYVAGFGALLYLWPVGCLHPASPTTATSLPEKASKQRLTAVSPPNVRVRSPSSQPKTANTSVPGWHELTVNGFEPSLVYFQPKAPKLIIAHGAGGQAQWHCEHFQRILADSATLICPQGKRRYTRDPSRGYYYPDHLALAQEVAAAVTAFEALYEAPEPQEKYHYVGYSQGATMGALAFAPQGNRFSYLVLIEGGFADFSLSLARRFRDSGGQGVLFICGTNSCRDRSRVAVARLKQLGLKAETHWAAGAGHRPDGPVAKALVSALPFVLSSDSRWNGKAPILPDDVLHGNG